MHIIAEKALIEFWTKHPDAEQPLKAWNQEVKKVKWESPADIKCKYKSASFIGDYIVVFYICWNKYRLIVKVAYKMQTVFIRFLGTYKEYDKIKEIGKI